MKVVITAMLLATGNFAAAADLTDRKLTTDGLGPLRVGMSYTEFAKLGLRHGNPDFRNTDFCTYVSLEGVEGIGVYFTRDAGKEFRLSTVHVQKQDVSTPSGAHVGITLPELKRIYGAKLTTERIRWPDQDLGLPERIFQVKSDSGRAMAFYPDDDDKNRVGMIHAGSSTVYIDCF